MLLMLLPHRFPHHPGRHAHHHHPAHNRPYTSTARLRRLQSRPMSDLWTVRRLLEWTSAFFTRKEVDSPRLSAELLLSHVLEAPRLKLYPDYGGVISDHQ